ncbi:hypothetical protein [Nodosilinea sp. LEGE 07088]|nr:hypothetical protein [Nodosilinea sp. LEGE 07088]
MNQADTKQKSIDILFFQKNKTTGADLDYTRGLPDKILLPIRKADSV